MSKYNFLDKFSENHSIRYLFSRIALEDNTEHNDKKYHHILSISSYYTEKRDDGLYYSDCLLMDENTNPEVHNNVLQNLKFNVNPLKYFERIELPILPLGKYWFPLNPSITFDEKDNKMTLICRFVNSVQQHRSWFCFDINESYQTRNILMKGKVESRQTNSKIEKQKNENKIEINENKIEIELRNKHIDITQCQRKQIKSNLILNPEFQTEIDTPSHTKYPAKYQGWEDVRLFYLKGELWGSGSIWTTNTISAEIAIGRFDTTQNYKVIDFVSIPSPYKQCEKNWMPLILKDELYFIYSLDPFKIYHCDVKTGKLTIFLENIKFPYNLKGLKGGSQVVLFNNGYLMIVHQTNHTQNESYYYHRFLWISNDWKEMKISLPFIFDSLGIEFCAGMIYVEKEHKFILSVGIKDCDAQLFQIDEKDVMKLLEV